MAVQFEVDGVQAIIASLSEFPKKYQNKVVKPAIKQAMTNIIFPDAQRRPPVGETGDLRRSLRVRVAKGLAGGASCRPMRRESAARLSARH